MFGGKEKGEKCKKDIPFETVGLFGCMYLWPGAHNFCMACHYVLNLYK